MRSPSGRFGAGPSAAIAVAVLCGAVVDITAAGAQTVEEGTELSAIPVPGRKPAPPPPAGGPSAPSGNGSALAVPPPPDLGTVPAPSAPAAPPALPTPIQPGAAPDLDTPPVPPPPPATDAMAGPSSSWPSTGAGLPGLPGAGNEAGHAPPPDPGPSAGAPAAMPGGNEFQLVFEPGSETLPEADQDLLTGIAARLAADQTARLQIRAYASGDADTARQARRLSLARALAVRDYLVGQGVRSTRINVRALGADAPEGPADRVDISLVN